MKQRMVIVGLGLIGGSMTIALKGFEDFEVVGVDISETTLTFAREQKIGDWVTDDVATAIGQAKVVILALHPKGIVQFLQKYAHHFPAGTLVTDVCGVKSAVMEAAACLPPEVDFIGCHPMAGTEFSGIEHAFGEMFHGAHFIFTPQKTSLPTHMALLERMVHHLGCREISVTTPEEHDQKIAYTSQMMHIIALAVCDDPNLFDIKGFEGSSFRGCTRVAALDVDLWAQLFAMNTPALLSVTDTLIHHLQEYRNLLADGDYGKLTERLIFSSDRKKMMALPGPDLLQ